MAATSVRVEQRSTGSQPFDAFLVARGVLGAAALERALRLHRDGAERLPTILLRLGLVSERALAAALAEYARVPEAAEDEFPAAPVLPERLSRKFLKQAGALPLAETPQGLVVAVADPLHREPLEAIAYATELPVICKVACASVLEKAFERLYGDGTDRTERIVARFEGAQTEARIEDAERLKDLARP